MGLSTGAKKEVGGEEGGGEQDSPGGVCGAFKFTNRPEDLSSLSLRVRCTLPLLFSDYNRDFTHSRPPVPPPLAAPGARFRRGSSNLRDARARSAFYSARRLHYFRRKTRKTRRFNRAVKINLVKARRKSDGKIRRRGERHRRAERKEEKKAAANARQIPENNSR